MDPVMVVIYKLLKSFLFEIVSSGKGELQVLPFRVLGATNEIKEARKTDTPSAQLSRSHKEVSESGPPFAQVLK